MKLVTQSTSTSWDKFYPESFRYDDDIDINRVNVFQLIDNSRIII